MKNQSANQDLKRQINRRIRQIKKIAKFVAKTVEKYGKRRKGGRSSEGERIFILGDFLFTANLLLDGNDRNSVSITHTSRTSADFSLEWKNDIEENGKWELTWNAQGSWLAEVERVMKKGAIEKRLSAAKRNEQSEQRRLTRERIESSERERLKSQAHSLGISVSD